MIIECVCKKFCPGTRTEYRKKRIFYLSKGRIEPKQFLLDFEQFTSFVFHIVNMMLPTLLYGKKMND